MVGVDVECSGPLSGWAGGFSEWLDERACPERVVRALRAFARFSAWMADRGLSAADLGEDLFEEYIRAEQQRSGSRVPAAFRYLGLAKRFLAAQGVLALRPTPSRDRGGMPRLLVGPLVEAIADLVAWLKIGGYTPGMALSVADTAARLSWWMNDEGLGVEHLSDGMLDRFVTAQLHGPVRHPSTARRLAAVRTQFLASERGLCKGAVAEYRGWGRGLLEQIAGPGGHIDWSLIDARTVNRYVTGRGQGYSRSSKRHLVTAMRSLLGWALATTRVEHDVTAAVLAPPPRRSEELPRALSRGQIEALKAAADTATPLGLGDYAIVVMIVRLGLRAGEVAALRLDDLDWHAGQFTVHGKGGRVLVLPVPTDVGQALVAYLRDVRPAGTLDRRVFLRVRPPLTGLSAKGVSNAVAALARRAGLGTVHAHRLRHTAATAVVAHGGSLIEARELLGHSRTDTTMIYARTDLASLRVLVLPWGQVPGA